MMDNPIPLLYNILLQTDTYFFTIASSIARNCFAIAHNCFAVAHNCFADAHNCSQSSLRSQAHLESKNMIYIYVIII